MTLTEIIILVAVNVITTLFVAATVRTGLGRLVYDLTATKKEIRRLAIISTHFESQVTALQKKVAVLEMVVTNGLGPRLKAVEKMSKVLVDGTQGE